MGILEAWHYPTKLFFGAADHTYVRCSTGAKAWSCWGGKSGGSLLRSGPGSTAQADAIAEPNERAGVTCYLINGVCHQAANRILFPAGIFVNGAKGYGLSEAIFGPYGRPTGPFGTCKAPFDRHDGVTGDLPGCVVPSAEAAGRRAFLSASQSRYFEQVSSAYGQVAPTGRLAESKEPNLVEFMTVLFDYKIDLNLGEALPGPRRSRLRDVRAAAEKSRLELDNAFAEKKINPLEFVAESDRQVLSFQRNAAGVLEPNEYEALFDLKHGDFIGLADPEIVARIYPQSSTT